MADPSYLIADCRFELKDPHWGAREHARETIPGAVYVHLDNDLSGPIPSPGSSSPGGRHPLPRRGDFAGRALDLGIDEHTHVVAFDHRGGPYAARLWWMLRAIGHEKVAVLDGGIEAWTQAGHPLAAGRPLEHRAQWPQLRPSEAPWPQTLTADELSESGRDWRLLDARAPERFSGELEPLDRFGGHIPGAKNFPFTDNLDAQGHFLPPQRLRERFAELSEAGELSDVVAYCGSGVTACHNLLALEIAGVHGARLYPGSWSDWISDESRPRAQGD